MYFIFFIILSQFYVKGIKKQYIQNLNSKGTIMNLNSKFIANQIFDISDLFHNLLILFYYN